MIRQRLGLIGAMALSLPLLGCPAPVDMGNGDSGINVEVTGGSSGATGGASGSTGGSSGSTGGASGSTGGSSGSTGGASSSTGGASGSTGGASGSTGGASGVDARPADTGGGSMAMGTKVPADVAAILKTSCVSGCHGSQYNDAATSYTRLIAPASATMGACQGTARITKGDGMASLIVTKMLGTAPCGANKRMPPAGAAVPMADIMKVISWINEGANPVP